MNDTPDEGPKFWLAVSINTGSSLLHWEQKTITRPNLIARLNDRSLLAPTKAAAGGYVAGRLQFADSKKCEDLNCARLHKNNKALVSRSMITFDADQPGATFLDDVKATGWAAIVHPTAGSTPEAPRWRLILEADASIDPGDYEALSRWCADGIGAHHFDPSTHQRVRTMYWPTLPKGGLDHYEVHVFEGEPVNVVEGTLLADLQGFTAPLAKEQPETYIDTSVPPTVEEQKMALRLLGWSAKSVAEAEDGVRNETLLRRGVRLWRLVMGDCIDEAEVLEKMREAYDASGAGVERDDFEHTFFDQARSYAAEFGADRPWGVEETPFDVVVDGEATGAASSDKTRGVVSGRIADGRLGQKSKVRVLPEPDAPAKVAEVFLLAHVGKGGCVEIRTWNGGCYEWAETHWSQIDDGTMLVELQTFTADATYWATTAGGGKVVKSWNPTDLKKKNLLNSIKATAGAYILPSVMPNTFFQCEDGSCAIGIEKDHRWLSHANGIFDVVTGEHMKHSPVFFNLTMRPFNYDRSVGDPKRWLGVLDDFWGHEPDKGKASIEAFGEQFGFLLFGRNSDRLKVIVVWQGPGDSGKSMVVDLLSLLLGHGGLVGLHPKTFVEKFGREVLIGAEVGVFSEADFTGVGRAAAGMAKEISGFDDHNIQRKSKTDVSGKVNARLLMVSNPIPKLDDSSGAINNRIQGTRFSRSFADHEQDLGLLEKLGEEFTEIAMWALEGYLRAVKRGGLRMSPSGQALADEIASKSSPLTAWFDERVEPKVGGKLTSAAATADFNMWCEENGLGDSAHYLSPEAFAKALKAAVPAMAPKVIRVGDETPRGYAGHQLIKVETEENVSVVADS